MSGGEAIRIALLADLDEPVGPEARSGDAMLTFELAESLAESVKDLGGLEVDLVARAGSWRGLPLISLNPEEVLPAPDTSLVRFALQDAAYCQLVLSGLLDDYHLIHCLAPITTPLQMLAARGSRIVLNLTRDEHHPSTRLPPALIGPGLLRTVSQHPVSSEAGGPVFIPVSVDLKRFRTAPGGLEERVLWSGAGGTQGEEATARLAAELGLSWSVCQGTDPVEQLRLARVLFHPCERAEPWGAHWPLRALASGVPVASWLGGGLESLVDHPSLGALAPPGDTGGLAQQLRLLPSRAEAGDRRRQRVLAAHSRRAVVARYRELYGALLEQGSG
jgi:hypothetical protein